MVLIHGLWMNGYDMLLMQHRFKHAGYSTSRFSYHSVNHSVISNADKLAEHLNKINTNKFYLVCHSLGGLVVRHLLARHTFNKIQSVVMLGTPNQTSCAANTLRQWPGGGFLLGNSLENGLLGPLPEWNSNIPLGVIAGDFRFGMGLIIPGIPRPNDGTVSVEETKLEGMQDHLILHASHFGLLVSKSTFRQTLIFFENGEFRC